MAKIGFIQPFKDFPFFWKYSEYLSKLWSIDITKSPLSGQWEPKNGKFIESFLIRAHNLWIVFDNKKKSRTHPLRQKYSARQPSILKCFIVITLVTILLFLTENRQWNRNNNSWKAGNFNLASKTMFSRYVAFSIVSR